MRSVVIAVPLALLLSAASGFAQAPAAPSAAPPAQAAPALPPPPPFPAGAKIGFVNLQQIAALSAEGKAATAKVTALITKKQNDAAAKSKQLQDNQNKLKTSGALLNDTARAALEKEVEKETVEEQRFQQDAQAEINELQTSLQSEFQQKLFPVLDELSKEHGLHVLLSVSDAGVIWVDPGIDLTLEAVKRFDAKPAAPAATKPAAAPAAPAPARP